MNPWVFIVGCPRSGTALLRRIVNAHPHIAITPQSHWIPQWFEEHTGPGSNGFATPEAISRLLEHPRFAALKIDREQLRVLTGTDRRMSYSRFIAEILDLYGKARGKTLVGIRTPGYVRKLQTLHAISATARFIHLIRDGRDVCLSMLSWAAAHERQRPATLVTWKDDPLSTVALWWERNVRLGREAGKSLGPELYYEIRYESLVSQPAEQCAALCAFLGLPYDDSMLRFHEGRTKSDPSLDAKSAWRPITPGLRDWKSQMPPEDLGRAEAAAGELLVELGYPRAVPHPPTEALDHASRMRERLARESRAGK